jgi:hypothetical protein
MLRMFAGVPQPDKELSFVTNPFKVIVLPDSAVVSRPKTEMVISVPPVVLE